MANELTVHQPSFLESILDPRVRRMWNADGFYVSILDVLEYHGHKTNPRLSWKQTLDWMTDRQGFSIGENDLRYCQFDGQGQRPTPVVGEELLYRLIQCSPIPEWEPMRRLIAQLLRNRMSGKLDEDADQQQVNAVLEAIKSCPKIANDPSGIVYLFSNRDGLCKIGMTTDIDRRWHSLEYHHGPLALLALIKTDDRYQQERELHQKYAHRHHHLEWFALSDDDIEEIKGLATGHYATSTTTGYTVGVTEREEIA